MRAYYNSLCLNCNGRISDERLLKLGLCENCVPSIPQKRKEIFKVLTKENKLWNYKGLLELEKSYEEFSKFFKRAIGQRMWSLQQVWIRRIMLRRSFSLVAPTGVGKTSLGLLYALFISLKNKKSYIIVPTSILVEQLARKVEELAEKLGMDFDFVYYLATMKKREKEECLERIRNGNFKILISTERFLINNFESIRSNNFDFIFIDDVDSFLKSRKNIDKVLICLGFSEEIVNDSLRLLELRKELNKLKKMKASTKKISKEIERIRKRVEEFKLRNKIGILVVSGATTKAKRTKRVKLFKELLGFELGYLPQFLRNIRDFYKESKELEKDTLEIIRKFGSGCLIFVPMEKGKAYAKNLAEYLKTNGINSYVYEKMEEDILENFENGFYDCLVGVASFRSPLARGIDLPERIRYVIFAGVPRFEIRLSAKEFNPTKLLTLIKNIREFFDEKTKEKIDDLIAQLKKIIPLSKEMIQKIEEACSNNLSLEGFEGFAQKIIIKTQKFLEKLLTRDLIEKIRKDETISLKEKANEFYLIISDPVAYIQASGRASRLFAGGISRGASILLVDDRKAFNGLVEKLSYFLEDISWESFELKKLARWFKQVDEDRKLIKEISEGKVSKRIKDYIKVALLIVESPTKAKTIAKFFGKPSKRLVGNLTVYETSTGEYILNIVATMGHLYDLIFSEGFHGVLKKENNFYPIYDFIKKCLKCGHQFTEYDSCPKCKSLEIVSKERIVGSLRKIALETNLIFIATDPDAEGEKIAYDLYCSLYPINSKIYRLEFHEITKKAILNAIANKRGINFSLVEAQIVRRIEDRWIGFELSQILWKVFKNRKLSAGRVQTPVLGWIIERTKESWEKKIVLNAKLENNLSIRIEEPKLEFDFREIYKKAREERAKVEVVKEEIRKVYPLPPYTTDALLKDASLKLNFSVNQTMRIAQDLFECGLITYHRTDSTSVSTFGINLAKDYIQKKFGKEFFVGRSYRKEGAHECIRPTRAIDPAKLKDLIFSGRIRFVKVLSEEHCMLYDLIFKRFMASQMREIEVKYQILKIKVFGNDTSLELAVEIIKEGFNRLVHFEVKRRVESGLYRIIFARIKRAPKAWPFSQGEVVGLMKERKIGRPSTYSKIVQVLLERKYVVERRNKLVNTKLGFKVYNFLIKNYGEYISEEVTRRLEAIMDRIEEGKEAYTNVLNELYAEIMRLKAR